MREIGHSVVDASLLSASRELVAGMGEAVGREGGAVEVSKRDMTTQEVANALRVSRPHVVKLIDTGVIPAYKAGKHRRVRTEDVSAYQRARKVQRDAVLQQLVDEAQATGMYDPPTPEQRAREVGQP